MKYYTNINYPGRIYGISEKLENKFIKYMESEGGCMVKVYPSENDEIVYVKDIRTDETYWGLVTE